MREKNLISCELMGGRLIIWYPLAISFFFFFLVSLSNLKTWLAIPKHAWFYQYIYGKNVCNLFNRYIFQTGLVCNFAPVIVVLINVQLLTMEISRKESQDQAHFEGIIWILSHSNELKRNQFFLLDNFALVVQVLWVPSK